MKFKATKVRSQQLFEWLIEEQIAMFQLTKQRAEILDNINAVGEEVTESLLQINSERYKNCKEMKQFCISNIIESHLSKEDLLKLQTLKPKSKDDTNYMM